MKRQAFVAGLGAAGAAGMAIRANAQVRFATPLPQGNQYPNQFLTQYTIGVCVTLSGPFGKYGNEVVRGVQAAVDESNRFTTPIGHVWGLRAYDDRNDTAQAQSNPSIAAADSTVIGIVGNLTKAMTLAALSRYANVGFAVVVPSVTADTITARGYHNIFRLPSKDTSAGTLFGSTVLEHKRGTSALAVALDGDYGSDVARGFVQGAKTNHVNADVLLFPQSGFDPAAAARSVLDRSPDYVFFAGKTPELGPLAEALRLEKFTGDMGASDGFYNSETIATYAATLDGGFVASNLPPLNRVPSAIGILTDFEHEMGAITALSAYGYAAAQVIISIAARAGAASRFSVLTAMQRNPSFTTLVGQYGFNTNGDPLIPNIYIYQVGKKGFTFSRPAIRNGFVL
ncbi:MAG TPA: branched-chain amino acid ABC transporter substrate-binding protein [Candidatus Tumulicola sp.]